MVTCVQCHMCKASTISCVVAVAKSTSPNWEAAMPSILLFLTDSMATNPCRLRGFLVSEVHSGGASGIWYHWCSELCVFVINETIIKTTNKCNLGKKGFIWLTDYNSPLRKAKAGTEVETVGEPTQWPASFPLARSEPIHTGWAFLNHTDNVMEAVPWWGLLPCVSRCVLTEAVPALKPLRGIYDIFQCHHWKAYAKGIAVTSEL